jgi:hypothetical protein
VMRGDGLAEVIDWRSHTPRPVPRRKPDLPRLRETFSGITVIADVHGMYHSLLSALSWARMRNHYSVFLGDLISYGPESLEVADEVYRIVMRGEGELIMGNHERKIARWANQMEQGRGSVRLSDGNRVTTTALNTLGPYARRRWLGRFRALVSQTGNLRQFDHVVLAHAAVHPGYWDGRASSRDIETMSLFGEFEQGSDAVRPARRYTWTEAVPRDMTVIVGHDIRSTMMPHSEVNERGGKTVFLDTGSGKGGQLSSADLRFHEDGLKVGNFNRY